MDKTRSGNAVQNGVRPKMHRSPASAARLWDEISILERRLAQIGPDGDCGYENAMIRFFEQQLSERRARLRDAERLSVKPGPTFDRV